MVVGSIENSVNLFILLFVLEIIDAKNQPELLETKVFSFNGNIFQSEGELKIQKQNRKKNMIRSRIEKERVKYEQRINNKSGIFETDKFNNTDQLNEEHNEEGDKEMSGQNFDKFQERQFETKIREYVPDLQAEQERTNSENIEEFTKCHLGLDKEIIYGYEGVGKQGRTYLKDTKDEHCSKNCDPIHLINNNISEKHLENEFYGLLDKLITDLNPTEKGIPPPDEISVQTTSERRSKTEMKFNLSKDLPSKTNPGDEVVSIYSGCSNDACTQTEKIKKVKKCNIL